MPILNSIKTLPPVANFLQNTIGVVLFSVLLGISVSVIAAGYEYAFFALSRFWTTFSQQFAYANVAYALGPFLAIPIIYWLINKIPEKRQHNPADLITGIHTNNGHINARANFYGVLASIFSIGLGYSVGHYVPTVQLGAGLGYLAHKIPWIHPQFVHISIGAGAAAAIAALFHAPLAAVLFVHEVLFRFFSVRAFAPISISAVSAYVMSHYFFEKDIIFNVGNDFAPIPSHYIFAATAGIVAALVGLLFIQSIIGLQRWARHYALSHWQQLSIAATTTALFLVVYPQIAGVNTQAQQQIVNGEIVVFSLLFGLFVAKFIASAVAIGLGVPGGIFGGAVFIGAALGGLLVTVFMAMMPNTITHPQILVLTTMAAMLSSVLGAPITMIVMTLELTGNFHILSVVMIAIVIANIVSFRFLGTSSYFDILLKSRGYDINASRDQVYAKTNTVQSLIVTDYVALKETTTPEIAEKSFLKQNTELVLVTDEDNNLVGELHLLDLKLFQIANRDAQTIEAAITPIDAIIYQNASIWRAMQRMKQTNDPFLPVIDGENNPKLLGIIYQQDLFNYYFDMLAMLRNQENAVAEKDN